MQADSPFEVRVQTTPLCGKGSVHSPSRPAPACACFQMDLESRDIASIRLVASLEFRDRVEKMFRSLGLLHVEDKGRPFVVVPSKQSLLFFRGGQELFAIPHLVRLFP